MRKGLALAAALLAVPAVMAAQQPPAPPAAASPPRADTSQPPGTRISLDDAIRLAVQHNHALQAARSTILQAARQIRKKGRDSRCVRNPGRLSFLACPGLLSCRPYRTPAWLAPLAELANCDSAIASSCSQRSRSLAVPCQLFPFASSGASDPLMTAVEGKQAN